MLSVVVWIADILEGEMASTVLEATIRDDSGERRVALLAEGSASLLTAAGFGFGVVEELPLVAGSPMSFALLGVGVAGGGAAVFALDRRLLGVDGASASGVASASGPGAAFLFLDFGTGAVGGGITSGDNLTSAAELSRADLRVAIVSDEKRGLIGLRLCTRWERVV